MLIQLHHHWIKKGKTVKTEMQAQKDIEKGNYNKLREFFTETNKSHPLPKGAGWIIFDERSEHFVKTSA